MKHSTFSVVRDLTLVILLILLTNYALHRRNTPTQKHPVSQVNVSQTFISHEIDQKFVELIDAVKKQIITLLQPSDQKYIIQQEKKKLQDIYELTNVLKQKYVKNSPALTLLGPIGTASIVLKEREITNKLLSSVNQIQTILILAINNDIEQLKNHPLFQTDTEYLIDSPSYEKYTSIKQGLIENKALITRLYNLRDALELA